MALPDHDEAALMRRALRLAKKGEGFVHPNPLVGALLLKDRRIIGQGYHTAIGCSHAEINAIANARKTGYEARGSTMVVTLEPCAHFGKTPPCVEAIVAAGISRIIIGMIDPNPTVSGRGIGYLRENGIRVRERVLEEECRAVNRAFIKYITRRRPYVILKTAMTLDGKIATRAGRSRWISGPESLRFAHKLRHVNQAVMVGARTVRVDNPRLTCRLPGRKKLSHPLRLILDGRLSIPRDAKVVSGKLPGETLILTTPLSDPEKRRALEDAGCRVLVLEGRGGRVGFPELMDALGKEKIASLMVEGGSEVLAQCLEAEVADRIYLVVAPKIFGGKEAPSFIGGRGVDDVDKAWRLSSMKLRRLGEDLLIEGDLLYPGQV